MKYKELIDKMTLEEKASLCVGGDYWNSKAIEKLNIPSITMSDGPHGLRVQKTKADNLGINESEISTCFPASSTIGNSWNKETAYMLGNTLGEEAAYENVDIVLGPAINIKRTPLCGRNFEYFSEDPYLTGVLASEYVKGLQTNGVGACVKHFAANNQENRRRTINAVVDERTLREIYLKAFEKIVKEAKPWSIMSAYNKLNGTYCNENQELMNILRKEWEFNGLVITDWGAENDRVSGLLAGNEIEMPGGRGNGVEEIIEAVKNKKVSEEYLNEVVSRILEYAFKGAERESLKEYNRQEHHNIARKLAEDSIVLLKNDEDILPIKNKKVAVIGDMAKRPRYQGAGSSTINPYRLTNLLDCLKEQGIECSYAQGYERVESENDVTLREEAIKVAKNSELVILCVGLTENFESEGMDRFTLDIPANQNKLIEEICKVNKKVVIVLSNGSPILMPWKDDVQAIITGYLGGEAGAEAMVNCLTGKVNPSGKLAETYPLSLEDTPCYNYYPGTEVSVEYKESIYVGYRYYDKISKNVLFPFGYGLSYTTFEYSNLNVEEDEEDIIVRLKIKNTGKVAGKEIAQVYIGQENSKIFKAKKELKGFEKVELEPEEEKEVMIKISKDELAYYDVNQNKWNIEKGTYNIYVGENVEDIVLKANLEIDGTTINKEFPSIYMTGNIEDVSDTDFEEILGHKIPTRYIDLKDLTVENTLEQFKNTKIGKKIFDHEMEKMDKLMKEQNVNKATKVMMDLQKPLKKFYEKKSSKYTKEMVEEFINTAKKDEENFDLDFVKLYLK